MNDFIFNGREIINEGVVIKVNIDVRNKRKILERLKERGDLHKRK